MLKAFLICIFNGIKIATNQKNTIMKKLFAAIVFAFAGMTAFAQPTSVPEIDPNAPVIKFEKDTVNYGVIENKANGWRTLSIKNTGKSPLVINNVHGECGCTTADSSGTKTWTTAPIAPGKTGFIKVHYATERTGIFNKRVFVDSNAKDKTMTFYIKGEVLAPGVKAPEPPKQVEAPKTSGKKGGKKAASDKK